MDPKTGFDRPSGYRMDASLHIAGIVGNLLRRVIAGTVVASACIAGPFSCSASASADPSGSTHAGRAAPFKVTVFLARQDDAVRSTSVAEKDTDPDGQDASAADSNTAPQESKSDNLETFTPSEEIEADQGVDFPYDI